MAVKKAVKRGPGRPPGSPNKKRPRSARSPVNRTGSITIDDIDKKNIALALTGSAAAVEKAFAPAPAEIFDQARGLIAGFDSLLSSCAAAGVDAVTVSICADQYRSAHKELLYRLALVK